MIEVMTMDQTGKKQNKNKKNKNSHWSVSTLAEKNKTNNKVPPDVDADQRPGNVTREVCRC